MYIDIYSTKNKYNVIYADPPWEYKQSGGSKLRGTAAQHYNTMLTKEICDLPVRNLCNEKSICFIWATFPNILEAVEVMKAWGFEYKTAAFVWVKKNKKSDTPFWGMGAYTRANAEVCLLGISKKTRAKEIVKRKNIHQIIYSAIREHSRKPDETRERIVQLLGDVPRIELFARQQIKGWDCWGDEIKEG